jgi:hypothetical protein
MIADIPTRDFIDFVLPQAPAQIAAKPPRAVAEHLPKNSLLLPYLAVAPLPHESPGVRHGKSPLSAFKLKPVTAIIGAIKKSIR